MKRRSSGLYAPDPHRLSLPRMAGGAPAFPTVVGDLGGHDTAVVSTHPVTWPTVPGGILSTHCALIIAATDRPPSHSYPDASFIEIQDVATAIGGNADVRLSVAFRRMAGGESGSFTLTSSSGTGGGWHVFILSGVDGGRNPEASAGQTTFGFANSGDPDSLSPSWGSADTLWFAVFANSRGDQSGAVASASPANYTNLVTDVFASVSGVGLSVARRQRTAATEDPGAFTHGTTGEAGRAITVAVPPDFGGGLGMVVG